MTIFFCQLCKEPFSARGLKLRRFCTRAHADEWKRRDRPSVEQLRQWYVAERLSCVDIGIMVDRDPKSVLAWMRAAGIPTRSRGAASSPGTFVKGQVGTFAGKRHTPETRALIRAASIADGRVPYLVNGKHHLKGVTGSAHPAWKGGLTPERQAFYSSDEWKETAKAVWIRDACTCQRCGCKPPRHGVKQHRGHVHHVVSFQVRELRAELSNLILLCADCHRWVHSNLNIAKEHIAA